MSFSHYTMSHPVLYFKHCTQGKLAETPENAFRKKSTWCLTSTETMRVIRDGMRFVLWGHKYSLRYFPQRMLRSNSPRAQPCTRAESARQIVRDVITHSSFRCKLDHVGGWLQGAVKSSDWGRGLSILQVSQIPPFKSSCYADQTGVSP